MRKLTALMLGLAIIVYTAMAVHAEHGRWQALENNPGCVVWNDNPKEQETVTWSGGCVSGKAQGTGVKVWQIFEDGEWKESRYEGGMQDGKNEGRGTCYYANDNRYEGGWKDDHRHGHGTLYYTDGGRYEGAFRNDKRHGHGTLYLPNGGRYEGEWRDNQANGHGTMYFASGNRYEGAFRDSNRHGRGTFYYADGNKFEGEFRDNQANGHGTMYFPSVIPVRASGAALTCKVPAVAGVKAVSRYAT